ncbi:MAG: DUF1501 domain-containing protein, partial [Myxococcota bacterium]
VTLSPDLSERILVVLELSGGNDGLNTVVPYADDEYYRLRPKIGIRRQNLLVLDERFGLNKGMVGMEKLWQAGQLAIIHGVGYPQPSFSHFNSMAYWHTAAPNSGASYGWMGRLADGLLPPGTKTPIVNVDATQSLAVRAREHVPVVFDDPRRFVPKGPRYTRTLDARHPNPSRAFLVDVARSAEEASQQVRAAWREYDSSVDYGLIDLDLRKIAALIEARLPTRLYYTSFRDNAFDTHVYQPNLHGRLLTYFSDAVYGFHQDLERMGRSQDVLLIVFSEFGRRAGENANLGTDHGTASVMFAMGSEVAGGHHGAPPSLTKLDDTENLVFTVDFRQVLASAMGGWLGYPNASEVLGGNFPALNLFV